MVLLLPNFRYGTFGTVGSSGSCGVQFKVQSDSFPLITVFLTTPIYSKHHFAPSGFQKVDQPVIPKTSESGPKGLVHCLNRSCRKVQLNAVTSHNPSQTILCYSCLLLVQTGSFCVLDSCAYMHTPAALCVIHRSTRSDQNRLESAITDIHKNQA